MRPMIENCLTNGVSGPASALWNRFMDLRQIPGFPGYAINELAEVYSYKGRDPKKLKQPPATGGYPRVSLRKSGKTHVMRVHKLMALVFLGPSEGRDVCHRDNNRKNNRLENLYYGTRSENQNDRKAHGTSSKRNRADQGSKHWKALRNAWIISRWLDGESQADLARLFRLTKPMVSLIVNDETGNNEVLERLRREIKEGKRSFRDDAIILQIQEEQS